MRVFVVLLAVVSATLAGENIVNLASSDPRVGLALFNEFQRFFDREYSAGEKRMRLALFRKFVKDAAAYNRQEDDVEYGLTVFADLTDAETQNRFGLNVTSDELNSMLTSDITVTGDKGTLSYKQHYGPCRDQGDTMACWAFAGTAVMEGHAAVQTKKYVAFSEQETADCTSGCSIDNGGSPYKAFTSIKKQDRLCTLHDYPFKGVDGDCDKAHKHKNALPYHITKTKLGSGDAKLAGALDGGPVAVGMNFDRQVSAYRGGIYKNTDCSRGVANHAVTLVGYAPDYWEIRNSYGVKGWGESGYGRFTRQRNNICKISSMFYFIETAPSKKVMEE